MGIPMLKRNNGFYREVELIAGRIACLDLGYGQDENYAIAFAQVSPALFVVFFSGRSLSAAQQESVEATVADLLRNPAQTRYLIHGAMNTNRDLVSHLESAAGAKNLNRGCAEKKALSYALEMKSNLTTLTPYMLKHGNKRMGNACKTDPCWSCAKSIDWFSGKNQ